MRVSRPRRPLPYEISGLGAPVHAGDPLPSWNDGAAKQAIVNFVRATITQGSPQFVPPAERIATFDQDGTLWVEHLICSQVMYCLDRVPAGGGGGACRRSGNDCGHRPVPSPHRSVSAGG
jgi:hypothetical protein